MSDEWSLLSSAYEDVLLPRFKPLYDLMGNKIIEYINLNKTKEKLRIVDYGTGPGEPLLTIIQLIKENSIKNIEFEGIDSSPGMISLAKQRFDKLNLNDIKMNLTLSSALSDQYHYDIILTSLVIPYVTDKKALLKEFYTKLNPNGLVINSYWSIPSRVPFLSLLKRINKYMSDGESISDENLNDNVSFSSSDEDIMKDLYKEQGFIIKESICFNLQMSFPNIRTFLSFSRIVSWFNDENLYLKAENETKRILNEEYGFHVNSNDSFQFNNDVIITIAAKEMAS